MNPHRLSMYVTFGLWALTACGPQAPVPALVRDATGSCSRGNGCYRYTYVLMGEGIECYAPVPSAPITLELGTWGGSDPTYGGSHPQTYAVNEPGTFKSNGHPNDANIWVDSVQVGGRVVVTSVTMEQGRKWMVGSYRVMLPDGRESSEEFDGSPCP